MYDPELGQFISRDPLPEHAANIVDMSPMAQRWRQNVAERGFLGGSMVEAYTKPYTYVGNNPVNRIDPSGLQSLDVLIKFMMWYEAEQAATLSWMTGLLPCPCTLIPTAYSVPCTIPGVPDVFEFKTVVVFEAPLGWEKYDRYQFGKLIGMDYHPGATYDVRSGPNDYGATQQCTYDAQGKLITHGPGAGTADRNAGSHTSSDVTPFDWARELDQGTFGFFSAMYETVRQTNSGNGCPTNPPVPIPANRPLGAIQGVVPFVD